MSKKNKENEEIKEQLLRQEAKLLEQEHRPLKVLWNYLTRKRKWQDKNDPRRKAVIKALVWRIITSQTTAVYFTGTVISIFSLMFTIKQTKLFELQNKILETQNKSIVQQTQIAESSRRSSQMIIMGEVLSDINQELRDKQNVKDTLSNTLVGRIISLSRAMKPYKYLENDSIIKRPLSPERGQLLISLLASKIDSAFFVNQILRESDFSYADLSKSNLKNANLVGANLRYVNLQESELDNAKLKKANLSYANLTKARLPMANIDSTGLKGANLTRAFFTNSSIKGTDLTNAVLYKTNFNSSNFQKTKLRGAQLTDVYLHNTTLDIKLKGVDMKNSDFTKVKIDKLDLRGVVSLDSILIDRKDWLPYIKDELKLKGAKNIYKLYKLDSIVDITYGTTYIIVKKER